MKPNKSNVRKMAEWSYIFNSFGWPADFPVGKPDGFDSMPTHEKDASIPTKYQAIKPHITQIENLIGEKEMLRYHHNKMGRSNFQFEAWWFVRNINGLGQRFVNENFYIDIYSIMGWRMGRKP